MFVCVDVVGRAFIFRCFAFAYHWAREFRTTTVYRTRPDQHSYLHNINSNNIYSQIVSSNKNIDFDNTRKQLQQRLRARFIRLAHAS